MDARLVFQLSCFLCSSCILSSDENVVSLQADLQVERK